MDFRGDVKRAEETDQAVSALRWFNVSDLKPAHLETDNVELLNNLILAFGFCVCVCELLLNT